MSLGRVRRPLSPDGGESPVVTTVSRDGENSPTSCCSAQDALYRMPAITATVDCTINYHWLCRSKSNYWGVWRLSPRSVTSAKSFYDLKRRTTSSLLPSRMLLTPLYP